MTNDKIIDKSNIKGFLGIIIFFLSAALLLIYANDARESVILGIKLSVLSIIPAIFPFFILSDLLLASFGSSGGYFGKLFSKIFNISPAALPAFIIGSLCGFPLGVKGAAELYKNGRISKEECEVLSGFVNNPSLAFVVSGVGAGMLGSLKLGFILYFSVIFSSIIIGYLSRPKSQNSQNSNNISKQSFNFSLSIKNAAFSSLTVSAYIIFFSMILGVLSEIIKNEAFLAFISPVFEVGNATKLLSQSSSFSFDFSFALIAFALGFSGLSVFLQALSYLPPEISRSKIFIIKTVIGVLSSIIAWLLFAAIK